MYSFFPAMQSLPDSGPQKSSTSQHSLPHFHQPPQSCMMFVPAKVSIQRPHLLMPTFTLRRCYIQLVCAVFLVLMVLIIRMLSNVRNTFVSFHADSDTDGELVVLPEEFAQKRGALCLDGSPAGYYIRQGKFLQIYLIPCRPAQIHSYCLILKDIT